MLTFAICPHDTETKESLQFWAKIAQQFANAIGEKIKLVTFKDFFEEKITITQKDCCNIHYANSISSYKLCKKGYLPVAKLKGVIDEFVLIGKTNYPVKQNTTTITTIYLETHILPLLYLKEFDFLHTSIQYVTTQREIYHAVKEGKADFGIMFKKDYERIEDDQKIPVLKEMPTKLSHFLMVEPKYYHKLKEVLEQDERFEIVSKEKFLRSLSVTFPIESILKIKEFYDVSKIVHEIPFVGILIYQDKILYANRYLQNALGYSFEEIQNLSVLDLVAEEDRDKIANIVQRRLKGEHFSSIHDLLKIKAKNGSFRYARVFGSTILFKEQYAGFVFAIDVTKELRYQRLYRVLRKINQAIATAMNEEELYKIICQTLVQELDIKFVWIGVPDEEEVFRSIYQCGEDEGYLQHIKVAVGENVAEGRGQTGRAFREGKVIINPQTETTDFMRPWKEEMLKRGYLSSAAIPIKRNGKVIATLNIYASEPFYFEEENRLLLEELEQDLSFALDKIETLQESLLLRNAIDRSSEWVIITDEEGIIEYVNDFVCQLTGYSKDEIIGKTPRIFKSGYHTQEFYEQLWQTILNGKEFNAVFVNRKKNGEVFYLEEKILPVTLPNGEKRFVSLGRDITKERELLRENEKLRFYDVLTNLYNFNGFFIYAEDYLSKHPKQLCGLLIIDIANFSYINKTFSVEVGDKVLKKIADLLKNHFKKDDLLGRIGGDQFGVFIKQLENKEDIFVILERVHALLDQEEIVNLNGHPIKLHFHGGVAIYPEDGQTFKELLQNASIALKEAKEEGLNIIKFFNKEIEKKISSKIVAEQLIQKALNENLFIFHYQPYFDAKTKELGGFEALVRIRDKEKIHYPNEFIDLLENSNYLDDFRRWAIQEVSDKIRHWRKPISLNLSARTFKNPNLVEEIADFTKVLPAYLTLEVTERLYMDDLQSSKKIVEELKRNDKIKLSIDDFGTGYSSLAYLKDMYADILKIDMSFVKSMINDKKSKAVVEAIITLAKAMDMQTVAEGVETKQQYEMLKDMGVDFIQGYYFAKPMPEEEVEKLLGLKN